MSESSIEIARKIATRYKRLGDLLGGELSGNSGELEKGLHTVEALESHGCYNQNIMKHVRPEHDYRNWSQPCTARPL